MTNEEAKNLIDRWVVITLIEGGVSLSERTRQALDMAIKALESCGDAISRDAVLDACSQSINILDAMSRIEDLQSVTPMHTEITLESAIDYLNSIGWMQEHDRILTGSAQSVTPKQRTGHCKDCKWWKDSDGTYRRGIKAESQCPINRKEVYEGNGYCYMFDPQESEEQA